MTLVTFVADTHLAARSPGADRNWQAVVDHVDGRRPDLVVHAGDISLDGADHVQDLEHSRNCLDRLAVQWRAVPGNHDTGDVGDEHHQPIDEARRARFRATIGEQFWLEDVGESWRVIGVDTQLLTSALDGVDESWAWLDDALSTARRTIVVGHRPIDPDGDEFTDSPHRYLHGADRERMFGTLAGGGAEMYVSGHVHQWRQGSLGSLDYVWVPSTWAVLPERSQEIIGDKVLGIVEIDLPDDADGHPQVTRVERAGMHFAVYGDDWPAPYAAH